MKRRIVGLSLMALAVAACAPAPGGTPVPTPTPTVEESAPSVSPEPSETPEVEESESVDPEDPTVEPDETTSGTTTETASAVPPPVEGSSAGTDESTPPAATGGWNVLDRQIRNDGDVDAAKLPDNLSHYLKSRLREPCNFEMVIFAAHAEGYMVGDESSTCAGEALFVYGPESAQVTRELVEFTEVPACSDFEKAGLPKNVPTTERFPDGLFCIDGGARKRY